MIDYISDLWEDTLLATRIVRETVDDILGDLRGALVCMMPLVAASFVMFAGLYGIFSLTPPEAFDATGQVDYTAEDAGIFALAMIVLLILFVVAWPWSAVAWHRKVVLREGTSSVFPRWQGGRILGYIGRTILVSVLALLASIPLLLLASAVVPNVVSQGNDGTAQSYEYTMGDGPTDLSPLGLAMWLVLSGFIYGLFLRLSLILPAGAVGKRLGVGQVWEGTKGHFFSLFVPLGLLLSVISTVLSLIASLVSFGGVLDILTFGMVTLLGIGVLTRLYLHFFPWDAPLVHRVDPVLT